MTTANGWHHHERVYIQARFGDMVLVQYVKRQPIKWRDSHRLDRPVLPWAWLPREDVMHDDELDDELMRVWKVA